MILSASSIRDLVYRFSKTVDIPLEKLDWIEGGLLNLKLGAVEEQKVASRSIFSSYLTPEPLRICEIGVDERIIPKGDPVRSYAKDGKMWWYLSPGVPYLLQTVETICLPPGYEALIVPRTSMFRGGGSFTASWVPYGFNGKLTTQFFIPSEGMPHRIEVGAYFCALKFFKVDSELPENLDKYGGQWTGDKMTTEGKATKGY